MTHLHHDHTGGLEHFPHTEILAVRKRVKRGTLESEKRADGRLYVFLDTDPPRSDTERLISTLEEQLALEREAHAEARRLLAAALERILALEPSSETQESPETPPEPVPGTTNPRKRRRAQRASRGG